MSSVAAFTFNVSDLIAGLTPSSQWEWHGPCQADIPVDPADVVQNKKRWNADLSVGPISESVRRYFFMLGDDEFHKELSAAEANGTDDALKVVTRGEILDVYVGLRPQRYELFRTFVTLHFGRSDLICRIVNGRMMFAMKGGMVIPTYNEFLGGQPYIIVGENSITFSAKPLP